MVSITIENVPEKLYALLKLSAESHHRSLIDEILACLEGTLPDESKLKTIQGASGIRLLDPEEIRAAIREGRP
jgi:plasmid stability protein